MAYHCIYFITVTLSLLACAASLECFNCTGVTNTDACQNNIACGENEVCFTQRKYSEKIIFDFGCVESQKCGDFANLPSGISRMETNQGQTHPCFECCSRDGCNSNLCQYKDPDVCVDDERFDCAYYNSLFNFCKDVNQAKKVCPKYCKLCQVVDGNWTPWLNWSDCDVTCENGTQVRTRSCTNPAPQNGGLDCWGNDTETKSCHREPCPIHGGWNTWSTWSECSVSCDIGMQHRDRHCTNPRPSRFGDHCFGSAEQYRICMPGACAIHGGWNTWSTWSECSVSCDIGLQHRDRSCTNPRPSLSGDHCFGNAEQYNICMPGACADGGWSAWGSWGTCSQSCDGGIMSRNRACSNPAPSTTGKHCVGNSEQVSVCKTQACQTCQASQASQASQKCKEYNVAFTAWDKTGISEYQTSLHFQQTWLNYGEAYDTRTGKFTCKVAGIYHFAVTLTKQRKDIDHIYTYLRINGSGKLYLSFFPNADGSNEVGQYMMSGAGTFHLDKNDVVDVYGVPSYFYNNIYCYFTGFLITPDQ